MYWAKNGPLCASQLLWIFQKHENLTKSWSLDKMLLTNFRDMQLYFTYNIMIVYRTIIIRFILYTTQMYTTTRNKKKSVFRHICKTLRLHNRWQAYSYSKRSMYTYELLNPMARKSNFCAKNIKNKNCVLCMKEWTNIFKYMYEKPHYSSTITQKSMDAVLVDINRGFTSFPPQVPLLMSPIMDERVPTIVPLQNFPKKHF